MPSEARKEFETRHPLLDDDFERNSLTVLRRDPSRRGFYLHNLNMRLKDFKRRVITGDVDFMTEYYKLNVWHPDFPKVDEHLDRRELLKYWYNLEVLASAYGSKDVADDVQLEDHAGLWRSMEFGSKKWTVKNVQEQLLKVEALHDRLDQVENSA